MYYKLVNMLQHIPIFSSILSFINASCCIMFMNEYTKTGDKKWFKNLSYLYLTNLFIDLFIQIYVCIAKPYQLTNQYETIIHHVLTILLILYGITFNFGIDVIPNIVCKLLLFETSTIFFDINIWVKEYLKNKMDDTSLLTTIIKKIKPFNEYLFGITFIYHRCFIFLKDIIFNKDNYTKIFEVQEHPNVRNFAIGAVFAFLILNIYWCSLILKRVYKEFIADNFFNLEKENKNDVELLLIEKLTLQFLDNKNG